jgi:CNT family concentrative nucleoside transporter
MVDKLQGLLGLVVFIALALPFSANRRAVRPGLVARTVLLQFALCFLLLRVPELAQLLAGLNVIVVGLSSATRAGSAFVFGYVGGAPPPFAVTEPRALSSFAFQVLPIIIVVSALAALLWHLRVLPVVIRGLAAFFARALGMSGPAGLAVTANVFLGQVEAPLLVRPYLSTMSRHDLLLLMTAGMTMIAGSMMVVYGALLADQYPNMIGQLLTKSLMSVPAAVLYAHLLLPEPPAERAPLPEPAVRDSGALDALMRGTQDGLFIWLNIIAVLLVLVALVAIANGLLGLVPGPAGTALSLERAAGWVFAPLAWLMGVPWPEAPRVGQLLGIKTVLNEFLAYLDLARPDAPVLAPHSRLIAIYALCGFANFASMGIQAQGLSAMAPERRADLNELAWPALYGATLASCMTGAIVGLVAF